MAKKKEIIEESVVEETGKKPSKEKTYTGKPCPDCKSTDSVVERGENLYCHECSVTFVK